MIHTGQLFLVEKPTVRLQIFECSEAIATVRIPTAI